jgi:hypothetical protein
LRTRTQRYRDDRFASPTTKTNKKNCREKLPMDRRQLLKIAAAMPLAQAGLTRGALAQGGYPNRNVTMIVPFPAGGQADLAARPVALALERLHAADDAVLAGGIAGSGPAVRPAGRL